jgi:hypothetical protein
MGSSYCKPELFLTRQANDCAAAAWIERTSVVRKKDVADKASHSVRDELKTKRIECACEYMFFNLIFFYANYTQKAADVFFCLNYL